MKMRTLIAGSVGILLLAGLAAQAAEMTKLGARSGSKMRIEGTSNIHDWRCESPLIGGSLEVGPNFPLEPGQTCAPGKVDVKGEAFVTARSLKSLKEDGSPYSDKMDEVMWEHLNAQKNPKIIFKVTDLTLKEAPTSKDAPYVFDAKGDLAVNGVTNAVAFPVKVLPLGDKKVKVSGSTSVKMSEFKVEPPSPKGLGLLIKTGDDVKIVFDWNLQQRAAAAGSAAATPAAAGSAAQ